MSLETTNPSLSRLDLLRFVPAAFAHSPHPAVSNVYEFIPTMPIVDDLLVRGWSIRSAHQNKGVDLAYASHRIVFDVPGAPARYQVGDVHPTATLYNSHNRTRVLSIVAGFFRTWCSNQCQTEVLSHSLDRVHVLGYSGLGLDDLVGQVMQQVGNMAQLFNRMKHQQLLGVARERFGQQALAVKHYNDPKFAYLYTREQSAQVLKPNRELDHGESLWLAFNTAQENLCSRVNKVTKNRQVNLKLWELTKSYLPA